MVANQPPDLVLIVATTVLQVPGIITSADAWQGLSNPGMLVPSTFLFLHIYLYIIWRMACAWQ